MKNINKILLGLVLMSPTIDIAAIAAPSDEALPELHSLAAKESLAGVLAVGESHRIQELQTLEDGEKFAKIIMRDGGAFWVQLPKDSQLAQGDTLVTDKLTYLWKTPIVEEIVAADGEATDDFSDLSDFAEAAGTGFPLTPGIGMAANCQNFVTKTGALGPWGSFIASTISPQTHPYLFKPAKDMSKVCPNFKSMSDSEKERFWIWLVAAVASNESSCTERVKAKGVRGATAAGLMQMHLGKEYLYKCKRGINSLKARDNLECGITILNNDIRRTGSVFPVKGNYYDTLRIKRPPGQHTLKLVRKYKPCG